MASTYEKCYRRIKRYCQTHFPRYKEIDRFLKLLAILHPKHVRLELLGHSLQGRPIQMIILQDNQSCPKNGVMIEAGIHAREWLSHTTALYLIDNVLNTKSMLKYMDFYVIPCINPDGYEFSHNCFRLWRKNMNKNHTMDPCNWGVDLNRNFPIAFGQDGSSANCESNKYHGEKPLSEPEARCLARALQRYYRYVKLYISIHCYGHLIMYPWGFTTRRCDDQDILHECAAKAQAAMKRKFPKSKFRVGQVSRSMYLSSGTSMDFVRGFYHIKFAYTMELHKEGKSGFDAKPQKILAVAEETMAGIESMVRYVYRYYTCICKRR